MELLSDEMIDFSKYEQETEESANVKPASVWMHELIDDIRRPKRKNHQLLPWRKTHGLVQFRPGEVTIWGGANGSGKSMVTGLVALGLLSQGQKVCVASFEMKPKKTLERMARQWSGTNPSDPAYAGSPEAIAYLIDLYQQFSEWSGGLYLYDQQGTVSAKKVAAVTRFCAQERSVTHMFIDSLMKCVAGEDDYNGQKGFVDELTAIARDHSIHIHLVHHIRKPSDDAHKPSKFDYKGSGAITDQVDNVITVWRNKPKERKIEQGQTVLDTEPDTLLICDKQRNGEWEGSIGLWFDKSSQQYLPAHGAEPMVLYRQIGDMES